MNAILYGMCAKHLCGPLSEVDDPDTVYGNFCFVFELSMDCVRLKFLVWD